MLCVPFAHGAVCRAGYKIVMNIFFGSFAPTLLPVPEQVIDNACVERFCILSRGIQYWFPPAHGHVDPYFKIFSCIQVRIQFSFVSWV